jgi:hypothetical protein
MSRARSRSPPRIKIVRTEARSQAVTAAIQDAVRIGIFMVVLESIAERGSRD